LHKRRSACVATAGTSWSYNFLDFAFCWSV
jgi:hypothetical protein